MTIPGYYGLEIGLGTGLEKDEAGRIEKPGLTIRRTASRAK
jgi:hypothetical protein